MTASGREATAGLYECESCGGIAFGNAPEGRCCGTAMSPLDPAAVDLPDTQLDRVLQVGLGLSPTSLEIACWLVEREEVRTREITAAHDYDRSTITRHLNRLHDVGLVERQSRSREGGGHVYLYSAGSSADLRRGFRRGLSVWMLEVLRALDDRLPEQP